MIRKRRTGQEVKFKMPDPIEKRVQLTFTVENATNKEQRDPTGPVIATG
jgi:anti-sigma-K factor RskA